MSLSINRLSIPQVNYSNSRKVGFGNDKDTEDEGYYHADGTCPYKYTKAYTGELISRKNYHTIPIHEKGECTSVKSETEAALKNRINELERILREQEQEIDILESRNSSSRRGRLFLNA